MPRRKGRGPIERFPVRPRKDGRFQKRIRGVLHYFGRDGNRDAALAEYDRVKHDLYAGRAPRQRPGEGDALPVARLVNLFLADKEHEVAEETLDGETFKQHKRALRRFVRWTGKARVWTDLSPDDFAAYRRHLRKSLGDYAYNRERASIVALFNHASQQDWIDRPPKYGKGFKRVPRGDLRGAKVSRLFSREDVNALLGLASPQLFAMILLGLNGGYGPKDCAALHWSAVDLDAGVIKDRRPKTNIPRTVPLWPETLWALRRLKRRGPRVFVTKYGNRWTGNAVAHEFAKLAVKCGLKAEGVKGRKRQPDGVTAYAGRHTFATFANEVRDTDARRHLMGRTVPNLDDVYVETFFLKRLSLVTEHVRFRLDVAATVGLYPSA